MKKIFFTILFLIYVSLSFSDEAFYFDDNSLLYTPTPTPTVIYKLTKYEIKVWNYLRDTKDLIELTEKDLKRYEKFLREKMDSHFLKMEDLIASINTKAVLFDRDKIEYKWDKIIRDAYRTIHIIEGYIDEFDENYDTMVKNQKKVKSILKKYRKKIQRPYEPEKRYEKNKKEMFFVKKGIKEYKKLFKYYMKKFNYLIKKKENKIKRLIREHKELHKP